MKLSERSLKAKEKFADGNISVANSIVSAVFIGVLVFPLIAFISAIVLGTEPFSSMKMPTWWQIGLFGGLYLSPILAAWYAKEIAMDLYDEIERTASKKKLRFSRSAHVRR